MAMTFNKPTISEAVKATGKVKITTTNTLDGLSDKELEPHVSAVKAQMEATKKAVMKAASKSVYQQAEQALEQAEAQVPEPVKSVVHVKEKTEAIVKAEELIDLYKRLTAANAFEILKQYEALKKELQSIAVESGADPAKPFVFNTDAGEVVFNASKQMNEIKDKAKLIELLGEDVFTSIAKVTLGDAKTYLSEIELSQCCEKVWGSRSLASVNPK